MERKTIAWLLVGVLAVPNAGYAEIVTVQRPSDPYVITDTIAIKPEEDPAQVLQIPIPQSMRIAQQVMDPQPAAAVNTPVPAVPASPEPSPPPSSVPVEEIGVTPISQEVPLVIPDSGVIAPIQENPAPAPALPPPPETAPAPQPAPAITADPDLAVIDPPAALPVAVVPPVSTPEVLVPSEPVAAPIDPVLGGEPVVFIDPTPPITEEVRTLLGMLPVYLEDSLTGVLSRENNEVLPVSAFQEYVSIDRAALDKLRALNPALSREPLRRLVRNMGREREVIASIAQLSNLRVTERAQGELDGIYNEVLDYLDDLGAGAPNLAGRFLIAVVDFFEAGTGYPEDALGFGIPRVGGVRGNHGLQVIQHIQRASPWIADAQILQFPFAGLPSQAVQSIFTAVRAGAKILNVSWSGNGLAQVGGRIVNQQPLVRRAVEWASRKLFFVAAAGNGTGARDGYDNLREVAAPARWATISVSTKQRVEGVMTGFFGNSHLADVAVEYIGGVVSRIVNGQRVLIQRGWDGESPLRNAGASFSTAIISGKVAELLRDRPRLWSETRGSNRARVIQLLRRDGYAPPPDPRGDARRNAPAPVLVGGEGIPGPSVPLPAAATTTTSATLTRS